MRLGFDASSLAPDGKGLARVQGELLETFARLELTPGLTVFAREDAPVPNVPGWRRVTVPPGSMLLWEQLRLPRAARRLGLEVVLTTSERAALWGPRQVVYVIEHPRHRARRARDTGTTTRQRLVDAITLALFPLALRRAEVVLAASHSTADDLERLAPARVVYLAVSERFSPGGTTGDYFLHLGSNDPRENTDVVLRAVAELARDAERVELVVAGGLGDSLGRLQAVARDLGISDRVSWLGFQTEDALIGLYRGAVAYVDPSLYEGFGLQALEALACGTPVIASNRTSLPEVVGDAGILLEPDDVAGFADAMRRLRTDGELRDELRRRALAQAARFSWERAAKEILAACAEIAARARREGEAAS